MAPSQGGARAIWWLVSLSCIFQSGQALLTDGEALLAFRAAVIDPLQVLNGWVGNPCTGANNSSSSWFGVTCTQGKVTRLELPQQGLSGKLVPELGDTKDLIWLDLGSNNLSGSIPVALGANWKPLQIWWMPQNQFIGPPPIITGMTSLWDLDISGNLLDGVLQTGYLNSSSVSAIRLAGNHLSGALPDPLDLPQCNTLNLSGNAFNGTIPMSWNQSEVLTTLDLSYNHLSGQLPTGLGLLPLNVLNVTGNQLSGPLPEAVANIRSLTEFSAANNNFSGPVPAAFFRSNLTLLDLTGNPGLVVSTPPGNSGQSDFMKVTISIAVAGATLAILVLCIVAALVRRSRRVCEPVDNSEAFKRAWGSREVHWQWYSLSVLETATSKFSEDRLLGRGGYGIVYRGKLPDGQEIAVKCLTACNSNDYQKLVVELETLGSLRNPYLLPLRGCCIEGGRQMLVYDFMRHGSLGDCLHPKAGQAPLDWPTRLQIALQVAKAIAFLHNDVSPPIIHRDIKADNVLLRDDMVAQVADFGLARLMEESFVSHISTRVAGTIGYVAPEYAALGELTTKSDVFSFGILLLEICSARRPVQREECQMMTLDIWARIKATRSRLADAMDPTLLATVNEASFEAVMKVALACVNQAPERPSMQEVVQALESTLSSERDCESGGPSDTPSES